MVRLSGEDTSSRRALWWKIYNTCVHQKTRQLRGRMNAGIDTSIPQGELKMMFVCSHKFICLFTNVLSFNDKKCKNECRKMSNIMKFTRF